MSRIRPDIEGYLISLRVVFEEIDHAEFERMRDSLRDAPRIFVAGVGRSGDMVRAFATRLAHLGRTAHVVHGSGTPPIGRDDLLVIGSGSGATPTMLTIAEEARRRDTRLGVITANALSPLGREADLRLVLPPHLPVSSPKDESPLQPLQTLFEHSLLLTLDALAAEVTSGGPDGGVDPGGRPS